MRAPDILRTRPRSRRVTSEEVEDFRLSTAQPGEPQEESRRLPTVVLRSGTTLAKPAPLFEESAFREKGKERAEHVLQFRGASDHREPGRS